MKGDIAVILKRIYSADGSEYDEIPLGVRIHNEPRPFHQGAKHMVVRIYSSVEEKYEKGGNMLSSSFSFSYQPIARERVVHDCGCFTLRHGDDRGEGVEVFWAGPGSISDWFEPGQLWNCAANEVPGFRIVSSEAFRLGQDAEVVDVARTLHRRGHNALG